MAHQPDELMASEPPKFGSLVRFIVLASLEVEAHTSGQPHPLQPQHQRVWQEPKVLHQQVLHQQQEPQVLHQQQEQVQP
eukprot:6475862-Amphidinium_carterae.1